jgi:UDP-N-acetylmuramate dehydrogenase
MSWYSGLEAVCRADVPLREHTWYGLGGPARWFCMPRHEEELAALLARCRDAGIAWRILGRGANVLVRDSGFDGAVIHFTGDAWEETTYDESVVRAAAGVDFTQLVRQSVERGLGGLENLAGIPGSVGGIIRMNAGGKYGNIGAYVQSVRLMSPAGMITERPAAQMGFTYRHSNVGENVVLAATLHLPPGDRDELRARFRQIWTEKAGSQPPVSARSAGCIFQNPPGKAAGQLIDAAGLKGARRGGAEISTKHANFILAYPEATAQDVLDLVALARDSVQAQFGIELQLEVEVW